MIGAKTTYTNNSKRVETAAKKSAFGNFKHAGASIRKDAIRSIRRRKDKRKASPEGDPPFTHSGLAKASIAFYASETEALIGFRHSKGGRIFAAHERGLEEEGRDYPKRPTMAPALERSVDRFHKDWRASL